MSDSDMPIGGDMGGLFTEQMIDALRRKDYFARLDRVLTSIDGKYSEVERLTKELAEAKDLACKLLGAIEAHKTQVLHTGSCFLDRSPDEVLWEALQ